MPKTSVFLALLAGALSLALAQPVAPRFRHLYVDDGMPESIANASYDPQWERPV